MREHERLSMIKWKHWLRQLCFLALLATNQLSFAWPMRGEVEPQIDAPTMVLPQEEVQQLPQSRLPVPKRFIAMTPKRLSLEEAILLSLRFNPGVMNANLSRVVQKFSLEVAYWNFEPQYSLTATGSYAVGAKPIYNNITPGVSINTPLGGSISLNENNIFTSAGSLSTATLQIIQPLLKGFGPDVALAALHNAVDQEKLNKLALKNTLINDVTTVISAYYKVVTDFNQIKVQETTLKNQVQLVEQIKLRLRVGKVSPADVINQESGIAAQRLQLEQLHITLLQDYQSLLTAIGLPPDAKLIIDKEMRITDLMVPKTQESVDLALTHNITYLTLVIGLDTLKRNLLVAEDNNRWSLNLTATQTKQLKATGSFVNPLNDVKTAQLNLTVPIDNMALESQVISSRIQLQQGRINLSEQKRLTISQVVNNVNNLESQKKQIELNEANLKLKRKVYENTYMQWSYGKRSYFDVVIAQNDLNTSELSDVNARFAYATALASFYQTLGTTLDQWGVKIKY